MLKIILEAGKVRKSGEVSEIKVGQLLISVFNGSTNQKPISQVVVTGNDWFRVKSGEEQLKYLKDIYNASVELFDGNERGRYAAGLRTLRDAMNLDELFRLDYVFMNEKLRDFLNIKEDGTMNYVFKVLNDSDDPKGWKETDSIGASYHQTEVQDARYLNAKFVNDDGREVVFDYKGNVVMSDFDKGTFNYSNATISTSWPLVGAVTNPLCHPDIQKRIGEDPCLMFGGQYIIGGGAHAKYDVQPYLDFILEKYKMEPIKRVNWDAPFTKNSKYWPKE